MKLIKLILLTTFLFFSNLHAETPYFIDFKYVLNESTAGKKAQKDLKAELETGLKGLKDKEKKIQEEEKKIIQQKKLINEEEYRKKVDELRTQVSKLQSERSKLLSSVAKKRQKAKSELLKNVNPIIETYMKEKNIKMVIDKRSLLVANKELDITKDITNLLNGKLKSINY
tara:strand:- start:2153 stop:2665 length:513 start_codon:yes stop_codon:yes gene_type:complete